MHLGIPAEAERARVSVGRRIWYSLLGGAVYRVVGAEATGAYGAFLAIAIASSAVLAVAVAVATSHGLSAIATAWPKLPDFSVSAGQLVLPPGVTQPVRVTGGGAVIVLDAKADPGGDLLGRAPAGVVLTGQEMLLRTGTVAGGDRLIPLSAFGAFPLTKASLGRLIERLSGVGVWLGAGASVVYAVVRDLIRAAVVGWVALMAVRFLGRDPGWPQAWRVGLAAWTLPMLAEAAQAVVPVPDWALWMVAGTYAVYGCSFLTSP